MASLGVIPLIPLWFLGGVVHPVGAMVVGLEGFLIKLTVVVHSLCSTGPRPCQH